MLILLKRATILRYQSITKTTKTKMKKVKKSLQSVNLSRRTASLMAISVFSITALGLTSTDIPFVNANSRQEINQLQGEIDKLNADSKDKKDTQGILSVEASSLSDAINQLQNQINASEARVAELQGEVNRLHKQIADTEAELEKQRKLLGEIIKTIYVEGDISTVEMLATSKDLSDFFDKQQYRESVQSKVKDTLDKVNKLKAELNSKKIAVQSALDEQKAASDQLASQRSEKDRVLAMNKDQQNQLEAQVKANSGKIAELRKKQIAAEAAMASAMSSGSYKTASVGPVGAGDVIGAVGSTGLSSGPHLHLEVRNGSGVQVDPSGYIQVRPVSPSSISQGYNVYNPLYASKHHKGIDYAASSGTPIRAIDGGNMYRGCSNAMLGTRNNDYGYVAIVEHSSGVKSVYAHMSGGPGACNYNTYYR